MSNPETDLRETLRTFAGEVANELGLEVVELRLHRARTKWHVRIDIDRAGAVGVGLEECERVSRRLGRTLEEGDVIPGSYVLEVSSPGLDRPIVTPDDFRRNTGRRVVVRTTEPIGGRQEFHGWLAACEQERVLVRQDDGEEIALPVSQIRLARQEVAF